MRIRTNNTPVHGSALIVTLMTATIISISLASYLTVITNQSRSTTRSLAWNTCIPVAEAGIEEALTQIHYRGFSNLTDNGWTKGQDGLYHKTRSIGDDGSYVQVTIEPVNPPIIVSVGYVPAPLSPSSQLGMIQSPSQSGPTYVSRSLRVQTSARGRFSTAMLAKENITFSGSARTDSFDSTDPNLSSNGKYDPTKARDRGDVASNGTVASTFVGSGTIILNGHLSTGPGGDYNLNGESSIGSTAWNQAGHSGQAEPGWTASDMNVEIPDVEIPFTSGYSTPGSATINGTSYKYVLGSGNYKLSQLVLGLSQKVLVTGDAVLYVSDTLSMSGASQIIIAPGARLQLYNGAPTASLGGNGVANQSGSAANFVYYGLSTNTRLDMNGSSGFIGAIYAPNADFTLSGGSSDGLIEFTGASVAKTVTMSGGRSYHYDESLARMFQDFVVVAWNEF